MILTNPIAIILDTTPLGLLTQKKGIPEAEACRSWADDLIDFGCLFFVPEIADYELRREFLRQGNSGAIARLDQFSANLSGAYLPLTTAPPDALDGDALIAAQAASLDFNLFGLAETVVATANVGHLAALTNAVL